MSSHQVSAVREKDSLISCHKCCKSHIIMANEVEGTRERLSRWGGSGVAKIEGMLTLHMQKYDSNQGPRHRFKMRGLKCNRPGAHLGGWRGWMHPLPFS